MILLKNIPFTFEEKNYEIKVLYNDTLINVVAFHNNYPANGFRHHIKVPGDFSVQEIVQQDVINELVEIAKTDICERRWERLLESEH